jgi:RNA polymerase sigma-54 factor
LERKEHPDDPVPFRTAVRIINECFDEFTKKHYSKIQKKLDIEENILKESVNMITRLNPKPGGISDGLVKTQYIIPDFILTNTDGKLEITLEFKECPRTQGEPIIF